MDNSAPEFFGYFYSLISSNYGVGDYAKGAAPVEDTTATTTDNHEGDVNSWTLDTTITNDVAFTSYTYTLANTV
jgi:hypothetical protein